MGIRQQQLNIVDPTFGEISADQGTIPATGIDLLGPNLQLARNAAVSAAISQNLGKRVNIGVVYGPQPSSQPAERGESQCAG